MCGSLYLAEEIYLNETHGPKRERKGRGEKASKNGRYLQYFIAEEKFREALLNLEKIGLLTADRGRCLRVGCDALLALKPAPSVRNVYIA